MRTIEDAHLYSQSPSESSNSGTVFETDHLEYEPGELTSQKKAEKVVDLSHNHEPAHMNKKQTKATLVTSNLEVIQEVSYEQGSTKKNSKVSSEVVPGLRIEDYIPKKFGPIDPKSFYKIYRTVTNSEDQTPKNEALKNGERANHFYADVGDLSAPSAPSEVYRQDEVKYSLYLTDGSLMPKEEQKSANQAGDLNHFSYHDYRQDNVNLLSFNNESQFQEREPEVLTESNNFKGIGQKIKPVGNSAQLPIPEECGEHETPEYKVIRNYFKF